MTIEFLIGMLERKIAHLSVLRTSAELLGDLERVSDLDTELAETQTTLTALRSL